MNKKGYENMNTVPNNYKYVLKYIWSLLFRSVCVAPASFYAWCVQERRCSETL